MLDKITTPKKVTSLAWRRFLQSEAGIEGQLILRENCPAVGIGEQHNIIFQAGVAEGWKRAIEAMHELIAVEVIKSENLENN